MNQEELISILNDLRSLPLETEWLEFKEAKNDFPFDKLGRYFSAISNESNLKNKRYGWLIFGVRDSDRKIVGSNYRRDQAKLESLKKEIANQTTSNLTFLDIFSLDLPEGRVVMFQIPAAPRGFPIAWQGHFYGRDGQSLGPLNLVELDLIRRPTESDWSAEICEGATLEDLEPTAILEARKKFTGKHKHLAIEVQQWDDRVFLNKAKITIADQITRTAILLLGKNESSHFISPAQAEITWVLKNAQNVERDYSHFGPPFLLSSEALFSKVRNLTYRYIVEQTLFPTEVSQYDPWVMRELLHNCIAHQDYNLHGRINVVEFDDSLLFTNLGAFIPQSIHQVIVQDSPPEHYRNPFLAQAMVKLDMIDTMGSGIRRMFSIQRDRFFPLPEYDLSDPQRVKVRLYGKILNEDYTRVLIRNTYLEIETVVLLDAVQKGKQIAKDEHKMLKKQNLVEGRYPNLHVSAKIADAVDDRAAYTLNKGLDKDYYKQLILKHLKKFGSSNRQEIDKILLPKLPNVLTSEQKSNKVKNILYEMSNKDKTIINAGVRGKPCWQLVSDKFRKG